jgi:hypothetical protein
MPNGSTGRCEAAPAAAFIIRRSSANGIEDELASRAIKLYTPTLEQIVNMLDRLRVNEN